MREALGGLGFESNIPYDFQLFTERGIVPIERKVHPSDLLASVSDGRLARECAAMRQASKFPIVLLEGNPQYTHDNKLRLPGRESRWGKAGIRNLIRSIEFVEGCYIERSDNIQDTVEVLKELQKYFDQKDHLSLRVRQGMEAAWLTPTYEERLTYFYQGLPGISVKLSRMLCERFNSPINLFSATSEQIQEIPGFGKGRANSITKFLQGELI